MIMTTCLILCIPPLFALLPLPPQPEKKTATSAGMTNRVRAVDRRDGAVLGSIAPSRVDRQRAGAGRAETSPLDSLASCQPRAVSSRLGANDRREAQHAEHDGQRG